MEILHVYGQLGAWLDGPTGKIRPYAEQLTDTGLYTAADAIRVIPDTRADDPVFYQAQEWLSNADQVCILGFGFDELNMHRLGLRHVLRPSVRYKRPSGTGPRLVASVFGKTKAEVDVLDRTIDTGGSVKEFLDFRNTLTLRSSAGYQECWFSP